MATSFKPMSKKIRKEDALEYHSQGRPGKIEVIPTKPTATARDLALAYSPGIAEPCLEIAKDPDLSYAYTARSNLVGVVSNGTAVLGLGDIGPYAGPTMLPVQPTNSIVPRERNFRMGLDSLSEPQCSQGFTPTVQALPPIGW